jgi:hypothetical protein
MNDSQVLKQLAETDAYAPDTEMSALAWSRETARSEIERRMGMEPQESTSKQQQQTVANGRREPAAGSPVATRPPQTNRRRASLIAAGAFAVTILVVAGVALLNSDDKPFGAESSLAVADDYFAEFNAGDSEAVMALFTPDATFAIRLGGQGLVHPSEVVVSGEGVSVRLVTYYRIMNNQEIGLLRKQLNELKKKATTLGEVMTAKMAYFELGAYGGVKQLGTFCDPP